MFSFFQNRKLERYLLTKSHDITALDDLLSAYLCGVLGDQMTDFGIRNTKITINWNPGNHSIDIRGKHTGHDVDIHLEDESFTLSFDGAAPRSYPLETETRFYAILKSALEKLA